LSYARLSRFGKDSWDFEGASCIAAPLCFAGTFSVRALKMFRSEAKGDMYSFRGKRGVSAARGTAVRCGILLAVSALAGLYSIDTRAQQVDSAAPVVVQPGAPGKPSKTLPPSTRATLPPLSQADVEFMQGMIMHHAQAVEMTALIPSHTENKDVRSLGARISSSQSDEIKFMRRWLATRGEATSAAMPGMSGMDKSGEPMTLMPGMLTPEQMEALRDAKGAEFDKLFLTCMIQHHNGALIMVKDLFDNAGAGQDAEIFNFATDVDSGQRAEIRIMQSMSGKKSLKEK
jgi:uncharacterized protein (DUF305 family)